MPNSYTHPVFAPSRLNCKNLSPSELTVYNSKISFYLTCTINVNRVKFKCLNGVKYGYLYLILVIAWIRMGLDNINLYT